MNSNIQDRRKTYNYDKAKPLTMWANRQLERFSSAPKAALDAELVQLQHADGVAQQAVGGGGRWVVARGEAVGEAGNPEDTAVPCCSEPCGLGVFEDVYIPAPDSTGLL